MDGRFVPNITLGPVIVQAIRQATEKPLNVHLMIVEPERYIEDFARAGADHLLVQAEPSSTIHLLSWIPSAGLIWLSVRLIGARLDFFSCIAIEALLAALRSVTIFIPASIGVQEAGYAALMPLFGLGPEVGLAVSLLRRARDVVVGVPVLLAWQALEGRRALVVE